eukprot:jgi/Picre1/34537/NNA_002005.t1
MDTWMKSTNAARDEAERARSKAESDRNSAQEARDQAMKQLVQESGARNCSTGKDDRLKKEFEDMKQSLMSEREALQLSEAERKATRKDLDHAMKDLVHIRRENERLGNTIANTSRQLEETRASLASSKDEIKVQAAKAKEFEKRANSMIDEAKRSVNQLRSSSLLQEGLGTKAEIGWQRLPRR